jgi:hypothetical protein
VKEHRKDDERLSALLQGQLSGPERDELLAHLAASDDDYEVFNDAVEILAALEEQDASSAAAEEPAAVIPLSQPQRPWRPPVRWLSLAAVLAGVALVSTLALRGRTPVGGNPVWLAAAVHTPGEGLPEGWTEEPLWPGDRGDASSGGTDEAMAARAGAKLVELAVAIRARDTAESQLRAMQLQDLEGGVGNATPLRVIGRRAGEPPEVLEDLLDEARDGLADRYENDEYLQLGAWTRAALFAAAARNEDFFRDDASRDMLGRAERLTRRDAAARDAVKQVSNAAETPNWDLLEPSLKTLLREIAS